MKYSTILFDFDGTLTESGIGITRSVAYAYEQLGLPVPGMETLLKFIGPPLVAAFQDYAGVDEPTAREATRLFRVRYNEIGWSENRVYPGIAPLLKELKQAGCYLAIASAKPLELVLKISRHFGIDKYFDKIVGTTAETANSSKDHLLRSALPENCDLTTAAMVGDRLFDMQAASRLGLHAVGVLYGYGSREELESSGADSIAETVAGLRAFLLPEAKPQRGLFITFEGADGCGKSTQMHKLVEYLSNRGYEVVVSREPGGCPISERIRDVVLDIRNMGMCDECEALLYAASRIQHVKEVILPAINSGKIMLCDRFLDSSFAYQARGRELGDGFIRQINEKAMAAVPDRTLLFAGDAEAILKRLRSGENLDRLEVETDDFFARVNRAYGEILAAEPDRVHAIASNRSIEEIFVDVCADIDALLA